MFPDICQCSQQPFGDGLDSDDALGQAIVVRIIFILRLFHHISPFFRFLLDIQIIYGRLLLLLIPLVWSVQGRPFCCGIFKEEEDSYSLMGNHFWLLAHSRAYFHVMNRQTVNLSWLSLFTTISSSSSSLALSLHQHHHHLLLLLSSSKLVLGSEKFGRGTCHLLIVQNLYKINVMIPGCHSIVTLHVIRGKESDLRKTGSKKTQQSKYLLKSPYSNYCNLHKIDVVILLCFLVCIIHSDNLTPRPL